MLQFTNYLIVNSGKSYVASDSLTNTVIYDSFAYSSIKDGIEIQSIPNLHREGD